MDNASFSNQLTQWMKTGSNSLMINIPSGSGIFRLIDIRPEKYLTGFVSLDAGSFKEACVSGNWAGTNLKTCFAESHPSGDPIYEVTRFNQDTPVLSVFNLPKEFQKAINDDKDLPVSGKFEKSHIVIDIAAKYLSGFSGVYFPSRREPEGGVLVYNPQALPSAKITYTGQLPPPSGVTDWV